MAIEKMFNGMFGKIAPGLCRLSMNGGIAIKTSNGYKTYNLKNNRLTNCTNFVFDIADDFFFVIPTNKVKRGDIIFANGTPKCVVKTENGTITAINYENAVVETILPERHVFMGNTYFYGKIVSMFGSDIINGKKGANKIMQYMLISEMMKGGKDNTRSDGNGINGMSSVLPLMMLSGGKMGDLFSGMFDDDGEDDENIITSLMNTDNNEDDESEDDE